MAGALYNRYRPRTFAEVVGQGHVTEALSAALTSGHLHHAFLFSGPRGCGKTSSARILAASLNCVSGPTAQPCGTCEHCVAIRTGSSLDVIELDAASHGGVDDTRELRERVAFAPASARMKVYIIDEAHMVSGAGFNALLKVVEEPPPHVVFVFATTDPDKVIPTIRSRTFHYRFRLVPPRELSALLSRVAAEEGVAVAPEALPLVIDAAGGSVRDALSLLDQLIAGAPADGVTHPYAAAMLGLTDAGFLDRTVDALTSRDAAGVFALVEDLASAGHDAERFARDLLARLRDLIVVATVPDAVERDLLPGYTGADVDRLRRQAAASGLAQLSRAADVVHTGIEDIRGTASPRLMLELVLARVLVPAATEDLPNMLARLDALERSAGARATGARPGADPAPEAPPAVRAAPAPEAPVARPRPAPAREAPPAAGPAPQAPPAPPAPPATPAPAVAPAPVAAVAPRPASSAAVSSDAPALDAVAVRERWPQVLATVFSLKRGTHSLLTDYAQVLTVGPEGLTLGMDPPAIRRVFTREASHTEVLSEALRTVLGRPMRVLVEPMPAGGAPAGGGGAGGGPGHGAGDPAAPGGAYRGEPDEPSADDPDDDGPGIGGGEAAALAALQAQLGARIIGEIDA